MPFQHSGIPLFHPSSFPSFQSSTIPAFCSRPELATYLPVASRVKPLQLSNLERQVLILLATPPVYRDWNIGPGRME